MRIAIALACACTFTSSLNAMVGGAPPAGEDAGGAVVMLTGSHGTFCSGVALTRDLVLTAAHCVLAGAGYKLVGFSFAGIPGIAIGHNAKIAWSLTCAYAATQELFVERPDPGDPRRFEYRGAFEPATIRYGMSCR